MSSKLNVNKKKTSKSQSKLKSKSHSCIHGEATSNVIAAKEQVKLLNSNGFQSYQNMSLSNGKKYTVECIHASSLDTSVRTWAFKLCKKFMKTTYEDSTIGWSDMRKYKELSSQSARFLIVRDAISKELAAYSHFRFDMDYGEEVIYCYELHVESSCQGTGIGKFLLKLLELFAATYKMKKVILTVFKANIGALGFYKKFGYEQDSTSPVDTQNTTFDYVILSRFINENDGR